MKSEFQAANAAAMDHGVDENIAPHLFLEDDMAAMHMASNIGSKIRRQPAHPRIVSEQLKAFTEFIEILGGLVQTKPLDAKDDCVL